MTKEQFLKTYGQPNTVVSFKNDAEKMEFLKECEKFDIKWISGYKATLCMGLSNFIDINKGNNISSDSEEYNKKLGNVFIPYTPSPKSLIKDGWMGVDRSGCKVIFAPTFKFHVNEVGITRLMENVYDDLTDKGWKHLDIMELYDNLGNLQWKREEKSAKDVEIDRIQAEMNKLAQDLSKLKGE